MNAYDALVTWDVTAVRRFFDKENCREYVIKEYEPIDMVCRSRRLHYETSFLECVRHLVRMGATANTKHGTLKQIIHLSRSTVLEFLRLTKADPNHRSFGSNQSLLMHAIISGKQSVAHALLRAGADPNVGVYEKTRDTLFTPSLPLHEAIVLKNREVIHDLLAHGADPFREDAWHGLRAIHWARNVDDPDIYTLFKNLEDARALHARTIHLLEKELVEYVFHPSRLLKQGYFEIVT
jgi:hypothetical protein